MLAESLKIQTTVQKNASESCDRWSCLQPQTIYSLKVQNLLIYAANFILECNFRLNSILQNHILVRSVILTCYEIELSLNPLSKT